jgi:hypothetical protein
MDKNNLNLRSVINSMKEFGKVKVGYRYHGIKEKYDDLFDKEKYEEITKQFYKDEESYNFCNLFIEDIVEVGVNFKSEGVSIKEIKGSKLFYLCEISASPSKCPDQFPMLIVASKIAKDFNVFLNKKITNEYCHHGNVNLSYINKLPLENDFIFRKQLNGVINAQDRLGEIIQKEADRLYNL